MDSTALTNHVVHDNIALKRFPWTSAVKWECVSTDAAPVYNHMQQKGDKEEPAISLKVHQALGVLGMNSRKTILVSAHRLHTTNTAMETL